MQSKAATVKEYIASLPEDRKAAIEAVRKVVLKNLDKDYEEGMSYGMIGWWVPHSVFPPGYHCDPKQGLPFAGLASQKQYMSLYMMGLYCGCIEGRTYTGLTAEAAWFRDAWAKSGAKKLDIGKACIRFKRLEDIPLDVIGEAIRRVPAKKFVERYVKVMGDLGRPVDGSKEAAAKKPAKRAAKRPAKKIAAKNTAGRKKTVKN